MKLTKVIERFVEDDMRGVHYAINVFVATTVVWVVVKVWGDSNPIWAVSSMIATSDPQLKQSMVTFRGRLLNTLLGCAIGLMVVAVGRTHWELPTALGLSVLVSSYLIRIPTMWRQAPITAAIIVAGGMQHHDKLGAFENGAIRVGEVIFGCLIGIASAWALSTIWPMPEKPSTNKS
jgi:uncharacterized membrane protein YccC